MTVDQYLDAFELNCRSTIAMCYEAVPAMREQQWGRVVAITSIAVRQPIPTLILSNTARAGRHRLPEDARPRDRGRRRDRQLAAARAPRDRAHRRAARRRRRSRPRASRPAMIGDPADFGRIAAFLCSEHARYVTGTALAVDGGADAALIMRTAPMFRHVVMLRWTPEATAGAARPRCRPALAACRARIPEIRSYAIGADARVNEGNFDLVIVADFDDVDGYLVYRDHPDHQAVITRAHPPDPRRIAPRCSTTISVCAGSRVDA